MVSFTALEFSEYDRVYQPQPMSDGAADYGTGLKGANHIGLSPQIYGNSENKLRKDHIINLVVRSEYGMQEHCYLQSGELTLPGFTRQPDIDWIPNEAKWRKRCLERLKRGGLENGLPNGYPQKVTEPPVWSGSDLENRESEYRFRFSSEDLQEIEQALLHFKELRLSFSFISQNTFPLPKLGPKIARLARQLYLGLGFFVLEGHRPEKFSAEDNVIVFTGISSYVAEIRGRQDEMGNMLLHLTDLGSSVAPDNLRQAPYSNVAQPFHSDLGEIIGLFALQQALQGGRSKLASVGQIYNELAAHRPDYIHTLQEPTWIFDRFDQIPAYTKRPILFHDHQNGHTSLCFSRRQLTGSAVSPRSTNIPPMTEAQADALDAVHFTAEKHCITLACKRGDMQFWNNLALLHAREGFIDEQLTDDNKDPKKRHLLRLWLRKIDNPWTSPWVLHQQLEEVYGDEGIHNGSIKEESWPVHPIKNFQHVTTRKRASGHG